MKKVLGAVAFGLFIVVLITFTGGFSQFNSAFEKVENYVERALGRGGTSTTIKTHELIEEESAVINAVEEVSPAVVSILVKSLEFDFYSGPIMSESGVGTGFIVDESGIIITNSHVVENPNGEYSVVLKNGDTYDVTKIDLDEVSDLAILEITARNLPTVKLGDSESIKVGQKAIAIGNALGRFQNTVTLGIISGVSRELTASSGLGGEVKTYESAIQTDAAINPGNSGGPLLNLSGQVIGINVATTRGADNIGFAIPVNVLKPILQSYLKEGRIVRPYMGVVYSMISQEVSTLRDLPEGAFVQRVLPDSPAAEAGLTRGDIIVRFEDKDLSEDYPLSRAIASFKVGDRVDLVIDRNGNRFDTSVVLAETPDSF